MTTRRIEVADLRSANEMTAAITARSRNVARAEEFVRETFGDETLHYMVRLREQSEGKPSFMLPRQIAKPDLQHAALYLSAEKQGYNVVTLEWTRDYMSIQGGYKRSYIELPLAYMGRKGNLVAKHITLLEGTSFTRKLAAGNFRICEVEIPEDGISFLKKELQDKIDALLSDSIEKRSYRIQELHSRMRSMIEGDRQIIADVSELGETAALGMLRKGSVVPGMEAVKYSGADGKILIERIGGQFMNVLSFTLQNVAPNLVLAVTDWNGDDVRIQQRYETAVNFLKGSGLYEPLQFFIPPLAEELNETITGSSKASLDSIVPAKSGICASAKLAPSDDLRATFIGAASSIIVAMRQATPALW